MFESLKKRRRGAYQAVPIPLELLDILSRCTAFTRRSGVAQARRCSGRGATWQASGRLQEIIMAVGIPDGPHACPKGLRHGFGVQAVSRGIALNMVQKWLGHAQFTTTTIYAKAAGEEEQSITGWI